MRLFFFILLLATGSFSKAQTRIYATNTGQIRFRSDAPMELIDVNSKELKGAIDPAKRTFAFRIRIKSFDGFNSRLQKEHFNENYMESEKIPEATFSGKIIEEIDFTQPGSYTIRAKGILNIHGVEQERIIKCDVEVSENKIRIKSIFPVLLSDHNIPIPRVVKEKLANEVKVEVSAELLIK